MMTKRKSVSIEGVVVPAEWDADGNIVAIAISARDEKDYGVAKHGKGNELMKLIRKDVMVTGEVTEESGKRIIQVEKYRARKKPGKQ